MDGGNQLKSSSIFLVNNPTTQTEIKIHFKAAVMSTRGDSIIPAAVSSEKQ